jgi:hypothetical protein
MGRPASSPGATSNKPTRRPLRANLSREGYTGITRLATNQIERVDAVLAGRQPDRPPVSFWYHFAPDAIWGPKAVAGHVRHAETYDLDFLKIMDDNRYPRPNTSSGVIPKPPRWSNLS